MDKPQEQTPEFETIPGLSESLAQLRAELNELKEIRESEEERNMKFWVGDLLANLIDKVYKRKTEALPDCIDGEDPKSLRRYTEAATLIVEKKRLKDMDGLSTRYYKSLQNFPLVSDRPL